jgi:protein tweety
LCSFSLSLFTGVSDKDPRDVTHDNFNRFDPKYVSIGPKNTAKTNLTSSKCATLKHSGKFGGSLSPNVRNYAQPSVQASTQTQTQTQQQLQIQQQQQQNHQHIQLQQHHLQKPNNQQLELQTYQLQQNFAPPQQQQQQQQGYNISTVSQEYNQQYPGAASMSFNKKAGNTGFTETSSILKKHREEVSEMVKPQSSVFSIETTSSHRDRHLESKGISIQQQPLPEIPQQHQPRSAPPQELSASTLASSNYPANYRSLQRPVMAKQSYSSATTQRNHRESRPAIPAKVNPPVLPPKNRHTLSRAQQPLPTIPSQSYNYHHQQQQTMPRGGYERERSRERDKAHGHGRSYDDSHQYRASSKQQYQQQQQQQNFQTLPHHHHHPQATFASSNTGTNKSKSTKRGSRELLRQPFENYSATEL